MTTEPLDLLWIVLCAALVFVMQAGFLCLESGLTRNKKSIDPDAKNLADFAIAEYMASEAIPQRLREIGVDYGQGFHVGKPRPLAELGSVCLMPRRGSGGRHWRLRSFEPKTVLQSSG
jgi:hypothetical protein